MMLCFFTFDRKAEKEPSAGPLKNCICCCTMSSSYVVVLCLLFLLLFLAFSGEGRQTIRGFLISKVLLAINYFHLAGQAYESRVKYPLETLV